MSSKSIREALVMGILSAISAAALPGCDQAGATLRNDLNSMARNQLTIRGNTFDVWLATSDEEITRGLMQVTEEELAPLSDGTPRGMLFAFDNERHLGFWMFNTITALDIAYIRSDGIIVKTYTMKPLDTSTYPSIVPARFALEVKAGTFSQLGIFEGDTVNLPEGT